MPVHALLVVILMDHADLAIKSMPEEKSSTRIILTTGSLVRILVVFLCLYFAYLIRDILAILFVAIVLSSAMEPSIEWMQKRRIPRIFGIAIIYIILVSVIGISIYLIIPPMITQFIQLANDFPMYVDRLQSMLSGFRNYTAAHGWLDNITNSFGSLTANLQNAAGSIISTVYNFFGGIFSIIIIFVITFYMAAEKNAIKKLVWSLTPEEKQSYVMDVFNRMQRKIGMWMRGQLILCLVIFAMTYLGLLIIGVKYALVLALIAGFTEFIPYLGPIIGAVPAVFLAFTQSPGLALLVAILYLIVQQLENNFLVPKIMEKTAGLNPIISMVVLMVGFSVGGVMGALLSIPVATAATVIVDDLLHKKRASENKLL